MESGVIDNFYLTDDNDLVMERYDEVQGKFLEVAFLDQEQVCLLFDTLLADYRCQIVDPAGHRHCHRCGRDIGPLSSHACANEALTSAQARRQ